MAGCVELEEGAPSRWGPRRSPCARPIRRANTRSRHRSRKLRTPPNPDIRRRLNRHPVRNNRVDLAARCRNHLSLRPVHRHSLSIELGSKDRHHLPRRDRRIRIAGRVSNPRKRNPRAPAGPHHPQPALLRFRMVTYHPVRKIKVPSPRRSREIDHLCSDRVDHTEIRLCHVAGHGESCQHPRRRRVSPFA